MEAVSWTQYNQSSTLAHVAQLRTSRHEEMSRRDSITSSRTGDSGYNSDPEITASPIELVYREDLPVLPETRCVAFPSNHQIPMELSVPDTVAAACGHSIGRYRGHSSPLLVRNFGVSKKLDSVVKPDVTSDPRTSTKRPATNKPDWTNAFKYPHNKSQTVVPPHISVTVDATGTENVEQWMDESFPSHGRPEVRVSSIVSLSSTGSGGDYSGTDDSEAEEATGMPSNNLSKATMKTIELLMRKIELNLRHAAYAQCAGEKTSRRQGTSDTSRRGSVQGPNAGGKRKARSDDGLQPNDQDDDGPTKRRRTSVTTTEDSEPGPRFACPFYKHEPNRYRHRRTCPGPGFPTVHRMKEHLYRAHAQPIFCPRCYMMFDADSDLANHLRSDPCEMSAQQSVEGIDRETLKHLHRRSPALRLEEDKWRDAYQLLFPHVHEADIPSPYYDSDSPTEASRRFRRELLRRVRQELFTTAEHEASPVEQNLLRQVAGIIHRCENDLINEFHSQNRSTPSVPTHIREAPPEPILATDPSSDVGRGSRTVTGSVDASTQDVPITHAPPVPRQSLRPSIPDYQYGPETQYLSQPSGDYVPAPFSDIIDWNAVIMPGYELHDVGPTDAYAPLSTPVRTAY